MNFVTSVWERWLLGERPMKLASSSEIGRSLRNALLARRASHWVRSSGVIVAGSFLWRRLELRASRLSAFVASTASATRARTRVVVSVPRARRLSCSVARITAVVRSAPASATGAAATAAAASTTGTTTSALAAAALRGLGAAFAATGVSAATGAVLVSFLAGILFVLVTDLTESISNAGYEYNNPYLFKSHSADRTNNYKTQSIWFGRIIQN